MGTVYALMVGINDYLDPGVRNLAGCVNDVDDALAFLRERRAPGIEVDEKVLLDGQATGGAIVRDIRGHLTKAGPGDVALFWFSGHGSEEPVGPFQDLEPNGRWLQTLVCADSRRDDNPDLLDKELALLLDEVARSGCHVVAVLDSCHSGGATRDTETVRFRVTDRASKPPAYRLLPDLLERYAAGPPPVRHVLLAACQPHEKAGEEELDGETRGRFSWALMQALRRARRGTTYRELALLARNEVERHSFTQRPLVFPDGRGPADSDLFGGGAIADPPTFTMSFGRRDWQVNAGLPHGMTTGTRFTVAGPAPGAEVAITAVDISGSRITPVGWEPDRQRVYRLELSRPPRPVLFAVADANDLRRRIGEDDPDVRVVDAGDAELIVERGPDGIRLTDQDGEQIAPLDAVPTGTGLRHIASWWRVRTLRNDESELNGAIELQVVEPLHGEVRTPRPGSTLHVAYEVEDGKPAAPCRLLRLHNTTGQPLYCVLLDLTERFKVDTLFRSGRIEAGATAAVGEGRATEFYLPLDLQAQPGRRYSDWLMLITSTHEIDPAPYVMPALDTTRGREARVRPQAEPVQRDWGTSVVRVVITGP
jgi:hypothetical protein